MHGLGKLAQRQNSLTTIPNPTHNSFHWLMDKPDFSNSYNTSQYCYCP